MPGIIKLEYEGPLAFVNLSHPGKLNAMSRAMWRELAVIFITLQASADVRCVVIRGESAAFCAGGDISEYPDFRFDERSLAEFHEDDVWGGLSAILKCDVPVVAQIVGACMGAGLEIASCCDIRIAGEGAKFGAPIARLGFPMAAREAQVVMAAAGELTLREMLLEASVLGAAEMKARGFLNRIVPDDKVASVALKAAQNIAALAPEAARLNKKIIRALKAYPASAAAKMTRIAYRYADSAEHREGITAFLGKRKPNF
ncbi:MAG: enoyl-CoA hydratase/isomerase family protein [Bdellovibrionales bacterium]|nr:enoyl-CoA hydratase/isomerase family protein [Ramlibacter sp.]